MEIWTGVTDALLTDSQRKDSATQLLLKYKSGVLVTQYQQMMMVVKMVMMVMMMVMNMMVI